MILIPRKGYLQHFGSKIAKIVRCYYHDLGQSEKNIFDFSLCDDSMQKLAYINISACVVTMVTHVVKFSRQSEKIDTPTLLNFEN